MLVYEDYFGRSYNYKKCTKCGTIKPATTTYFHCNIGSKFGLNSKCKVCRNVYNKNWYINNIERKRERDRKKYLKHKVEILARCKRWRENNPEKISMYRRNYRARKRKAEGFHTAEDIKLHYKTQEGRCWYCQKELNGTYHVEHRCPLSRGGSNWPENISLTCEYCNLSKGDKLPWEWCGRLL